MYEFRIAKVGATFLYLKILSMSVKFNSKTKKLDGEVLVSLEDSRIPSFLDLHCHVVDKMFKSSGIGASKHLNEGGFHGLIIVARNNDSVRTKSRGDIPAST